MTIPEPVYSDDLANLSTEQVEQHNRIYSLPDIKVKSDMGTYYWQWCYRGSVRAESGVTLEGDCGLYQLRFTKNWQANNVVQDIQYSDYQDKIACILFSAVHEELLCIIEQVLDDRCVVTNLDTVQFTDSPDELMPENGHDQALGFKLLDHRKNHKAEGVIYMSTAQLTRIARQEKQCPESRDERFDDLLFRLPLQIDSVRLSYRELKSLAPGSVIRLDNKTLAKNKASVSIVLGASHLVAEITETRGKINFNASPQNDSGDL